MSWRGKYLSPLGEMMHIPMLSTIGASRSFEDVPLDGWNDVPKPRTARSSDVFCQARICGDSLIDAGIHEGDVAVIRTTFDNWELKPGQLLAVWSPYGLLLKFVYWTLKGEVRLVSANKACADIVLDAEDVAIKGVVEYTMHYWR
jgi:SOS-response transcriptional repressor LexA